MESTDALADRLDSLVASIKAPWSDDEIATARRAWNAYDRVRLKISTGLEASFAEYSALRAAHIAGTPVPDAELEASVARIGTELDRIVGALDRNERELFDLVGERSRIECEHIEVRRTKDSGLRSALEAWRGELRADLRTSSLSLKHSTPSSPDADSEQQPARPVARPRASTASVDAMVSSAEDGRSSTQHAPSKPAETAPKAESSPPPAPARAPVHATARPSSPSPASPASPASPTTSSRPERALVLYHEDPSLADERPAPDAWISSLVIRTSTDTAPLLDGIEKAARHVPMLVVYGSNGEVDARGEPSVFNGHPRGDDLRSLFSALAGSGLTTDCLVADFSYSLYWLTELRPLIADDGVLVAVSTRSEGALSASASSMLARDDLPSSPSPSSGVVRDLLEHAEEQLASRHDALFGTPHAAYLARDGVVVCGGDDGLFRYMLLDTAHANADVEATTRALERLRSLAAAGTTIRELVQDYARADLAEGFLAEVERRLEASTATTP